MKFVVEVTLAVVQKALNVATGNVVRNLWRIRFLLTSGPRKFFMIDHESAAHFDFNERKYVDQQHHPFLCPLC
jgi:hypothetical protein